MLDITLLSFYNFIILQYTTYDYFIHLYASLCTPIYSYIIYHIGNCRNILEYKLRHNGQPWANIALCSLTISYHFIFLYCFVILFRKIGISICLNNFDVLCILNTFEQFRYVINCYYMCIQLSSLFNLFYTILHQDVLDVFCMSRFGIERQCLILFDIRSVLLF